MSTLVTLNIITLTFAMPSVTAQSVGKLCNCVILLNFKMPTVIIPCIIMPNGIISVGILSIIMPSVMALFIRMTVWISQPGNPY